MADKTKDRRCGTCRFLIVPLDKAGRRVVRTESAYACELGMKLAALERAGASSPFPAVPSCVTIRVSATYMDPTGGKTCPTWEQFKKEKTS